MTGSIPRRLHRIWLGRTPLPDHLGEYSARWQELHPSWEHHLWTEDNLPELRNAQEFARCGPAQQADIARYEVLATMGGIYVDVDVEPVRPLDTLLQYVEDRGFRAFAATDDGVRVTTTVLGTVPEHPLFTDVVRALPGSLVSHSGEPVEVQTGAGLFSAVHWDRLARGDEAIEVLPPPLFFPYLWHERPVAPSEVPDSYGIHHWGVGKASGTPAVDDDVLSERERTFTEIFHESRWGNGESVSGWGSARENTRALTSQLTDVVAHLRIRSLLDVPCGDLNWMGPLLDRGLVREYIGGDIVAPLIDRLTRTASGPGRTYQQVDAVTGPVPRCDAVLCRDLLIHLPLADALAVLRTLSNSGAKWLLVSTYAGRLRNEDAPVGGWRPLNLTQPPFDLPQPVLLLPEERAVADGGRYVDQCLGVWKASVVRRTLGTGRRP